MRQAVLTKKLFQGAKIQREQVHGNKIRDILNDKIKKSANKQGRLGRGNNAKTARNSDML